MNALKILFALTLTNTLWLSNQLVLAEELSQRAQVSLITVSPGPALYSCWGHALLRVYDPSQHLDRVYNYGTFSAESWLFYIRFLQGSWPVKLSVTDISREMDHWKYENRSAREQILNLAFSQKQKLFQALETNSLPENSTYQYKPFADNCATKPRDLIIAFAGGNLEFHNDGLPEKSYRDWMNAYFDHSPWAKFGINIALGTPVDRVASAWESMFLPDNLHNQLAIAVLKQYENNVPFVKSDQILFEAIPNQTEVNPPFTPTLLAVLILLLISGISLTQYYGKKFSLWPDRIIFGLAGIVGWFLLLLWVATSHDITDWNASLLWLMPLHIPFAFVKMTSDKSKIYYALTAVLILSGVFLSRVPGIADEILCTALVIRCIFRIYTAKQIRILQN